MAELQEPGAALAEAPADPSGSSGGVASQALTIRKWSVVGNDRLLGGVDNGRGGVRTIITSPVVQVRLVGERQLPLALTASGSGYWLGEPIAAFGQERAERFVWQKARGPVQWQGVPDPSLRTTPMKL